MRNYKKTRNYLHYTLGYKISTSHKIMKKFMGVNFISLQDAGDYIQHHWHDFMNFYGTIKNDYKKDDKLHNTPRYSEWDDISEALRYTNGCADDF